MELDLIVNLLMCNMFRVKTGKQHISCDMRNFTRLGRTGYLHLQGHAYLGSFFLDPEDIRNLSLWAIWYFIKGTGLP
jgi:hypothetical protein